MSLLLILVLQGHAHAQSSQIQGPRDNAQVYSGVVYGPIDQNDTLWRIASRYKQDSQFSVYQVMLAIYELNQQAFENGNFNTMVNGATLRLPSDRYIARMDVQAGRAKAERDDRAFGRQNSVQSTNSQSSGQTPSNEATTTSQANLKPDVPLVNQEDLSKTQSQLQSQLNGLRRQQQEQFVALKNQVAASINSVEILLDENRKLNDRLQQIDENNRNLTTKVETELQVQIDQQVEQLNQLIDLIKNAEQRRIDEESKSILALLSSNTAIILMSVAFTLLALIGFGIFLLRKTGPKTESTEHVDKKSKANDDIVDDDLVIGEMDDETDQDSDDLLAALEQDVDSQDDDILSDELEDDDVLAALDDDDLGGGFDIDDELGADLTDDNGASDEGFDGLDDDMLVPDSPASEKKADIEKTTEELDFDEISLDDDEAVDGISLDEDSGTESEAAPNEEIDLSDVGDESDVAGAETKEDSDGEITQNPNPFEEEPELSEDGTPQGIDLDENGDIDEDTLDQIEQKIEEKDKTINSLADELLEELDSSSDEESTTASAADSTVEDSDTASSGEKPSQRDKDTAALDLSTDKDSAVIDDADVEALMDGLDDVIDMDADDGALDDDNTDLSDELLSELEQDSEVQDELDALLADEEALEPESPEDSTSESKAANGELEEQVLDLSNSEDAVEELIDEEDTIDLSGSDDESSGDASHEQRDGQRDEQRDGQRNDQGLSDDVSALADELLEELESDDQESDELDSLLNELDQELDDGLETGDSELDADKSKTLDADDLLDDIPSFTSGIEELDDTPIEDSAESDDKPERTNKLQEQDAPDAERENKPEESVDTVQDDAAEQEVADDDDIALEPDTKVDNANIEAVDTELAADDSTSKDTAEGSLDALVDNDDFNKDQDVLSGLPDLDDWLDEEEPQQQTTDSDADDSTNESELNTLEDEIDSGLDLSALELDDIDLDNDDLMDINDNESPSEGSEDDILQGLDDADFDDMLNDLSDNETASLDDPLAQAGLDIEALMTDENMSDIAEKGELSSNNDEEVEDIDDAFVDVDDLLKESDAMPEMQDDDLDLDLENSLEKLVPGGNETNNEPLSDDENDQASNLDLAQVYIDMEDFEAAQELLDEVVRKGTEQQKAEAVSLLDSFS